MHMLIAEEGALANRKISRAFLRQSVLLLGCLQVLPLCSCTKQSQVDGLVSVDSPCVLAAKPSEYADRKIKVTAFITSTKEGGFIWGDGCKYPGISLSLGEALAQDAKFRDVLLKYGMSPTPIRATLIGRFQYKRFTGLRALIFGQKMFEVEQVMDLQISP
jgi:hypothetical protein